MWDSTSRSDGSCPAVQTVADLLNSCRRCTDPAEIGNEDTNVDEVVERRDIGNDHIAVRLLIEEAQTFVPKRRPATEAAFHPALLNRVVRKLIRVVHGALSPPKSLVKLREALSHGREIDNPVLGREMHSRSDRTFRLRDLAEDWRARNRNDRSAAALGGRQATRRGSPRSSAARTGTVRTCGVQGRPSF